MTHTQELLAALKGVVVVADRKTDEFDRARAAIAMAEGRGATEDRSPLTLISIAYQNLLLIRHESDSRVRMQRALCECRDELARITGRTSESIQDEFERALTSGNGEREGAK